MKDFERKKKHCQLLTAGFSRHFLPQLDALFSCVAYIMYLWPKSLQKCLAREKMNGDFLGGKSRDRYLSNYRK